ncbi:AraC family transcriptional regulator ligand-binding domain-containing protein [Streptomyces showdoensis]|uniref:AraC family transcriptional regulator ligand-binding domain-containing protein n=1 Tax=Streptomyces showdoensis TaxID=68268 RepID=UPI0013F4D011|nr:AraC family transcriptional regulator ligand-binding domain-containing protein [Streptomyces showdoensis]
MSDPMAPCGTALPEPLPASRTHPGTKPASFTRLMLHSASLLGIRESAGTDLLGLAPAQLNDNRYRTPSATNGRIWELMTTRAPWAEVAAVMTQESSLGRLGVWDYLITSAVTPLEGIQDGARYLAAAGDVRSHTLLVDDDGDEVTISHVNDADLGYEAANAVRSYILGVVWRRRCEARQRSIAPVRAALAAQAPQRHDTLAGLFGTRVIDFERPVGSITFRTADLRAPGPYAQPGLSALLRRDTEQGLARAIPLHDWLDLFRTVLRGAVEEGGQELTLAALARRMTLGGRTLQRRLDAHGTTWRAELETARRERITRLLETTDRTTDAIAAENGYADARALRRAVTRWTGRTPSELRRRAPRAAPPVTDAP